MKYIADNALEDECVTHLRDFLMHSCSVLLSNLVKRELGLLGENGSQKLINSVYNVIATCEAIASKGTTEQREEAIKKARKTFSRENLAKE